MMGAGFPRPGVDGTVIGLTSPTPPQGVVGVQKVRDAMTAFYKVYDDLHAAIAAVERIEVP